MPIRRVVLAPMPPVGDHREHRTAKFALHPFSRTYEKGSGDPDKMQVSFWVATGEPSVSIAILDRSLLCVLTTGCMICSLTRLS